MRSRFKLLLALSIAFLPSVAAAAVAHDARAAPYPKPLRPPKAAPLHDPGTGTPHSAADIIVTASRVDLLGKATAASQGSVTQKELALRPIFRPGQLFESIPGLVVTIHSGEGKANQYLIRGFNLDHGTDFANFVDDMPVNRPTNTHGQGYSDLAFLIPAIVNGLDYTKGPYYAAIGDFGSVASSHARLANQIPNQVSATIATNGYQSALAAGTLAVAGGHLLGALELAHYDGPWKPPENFRKANAALRYGRGDDRNGFSLTGMFYKSAGLLTTDQPLRAVRSGSIDRYGTLDPTDASRSLRYSLSARLDRPVGDAGQLAISLYVIHSTMTLWNNFTHYLDDPVNGDQERQRERRETIGGAATYTRHSMVGAVSSDTVLGLQVRYDDAFVDRSHTLRRTTVLPYCTLEQEDGSVSSYAAVTGYCNADSVHLLDVAPFIQNSTHWTPWLHTVVGVREEHYGATDRSTVTGTSGHGHQLLFQPKGNVILGPWAKTEFYASWGRGFHSDDVRGVFGTVPGQGIPLAGGPTPLLARTTGMELGIRSNIVPRLTMQLAVFQQDFVSELTYNADSGQDEAGPPSRRQGIELSGQYHPLRWLELNTDLAFSKPRYRSTGLAAYDFSERYIADAPSFIGSFGILVDHLGRWSGGLQWRKLGTSPLADGQRYPEDKGYSEFNADIGYVISDRWKLQVSLFNILNSHDDAAEYYYTSRLPGEAAAGVADVQVHPLEARSARFSITRMF